MDEKAYKQFSLLSSIKITSLSLYSTSISGKLRPLTCNELLQTWETRNPFYLHQDVQAIEERPAPKSGVTTNDNSLQ